MTIRSAKTSNPAGTGAIAIEAVLLDILDDLQRNVGGGRAVGMHAILFVGTRQAIRELRACLGGHQW